MILLIDQYLTYLFSFPFGLCVAFLCYGIVCIPIVFFLYYLLPQQYKHNKLSIMILLLSISVFIPLLGIALIVILALALRLYTRYFRFIETSSLDQPVFKHERTPQTLQMGSGGAIARLRGTHFDSSERIESLIAINALSTSESNLINHEMLHDNQDELRLYAHKHLENQEQEIYDSIDGKFKSFNIAKDKKIKAKLAKDIAHLNYNLIYLNLTKSQIVIEKIIHNAEHYAEIALQFNQDDYIMWILLGKIALRKKEYLKSLDYLNKAIRLGAPKTRIAPYLAENYFYTKNFSQLRQCFDKDSMIKFIPKLGEIMKFWCYEKK